MQMRAVELLPVCTFVWRVVCVYTQTENLRRRVCLPTKSIPCHGGPLVTVRNVRRIVYTHARAYMCVCVYTLIV